MWKLLPVARSGAPADARAADAGPASRTASRYQQYEIFRDHGGALDLAAYGYGARWMSRIDGADRADDRRAPRHGRVLPAPRPPSGGRPAVRRERRPRADGPSGRRAQPRATGSAGSAATRRSSAGRSRSAALPFTIVGVAPAEFFGAEVGDVAELLPARDDAAGGDADERQPARATRTSRRPWLRVLGRLKPGVSARTGDGAAQCAGRHAGDRMAAAQQVHRRSSRTRGWS